MKENLKERLKRESAERARQERKERNSADGLKKLRKCIYQWQKQSIKKLLMV